MKSETVHVIALFAFSWYVQAVVAQDVTTTTTGSAPDDANTTESEAAIRERNIQLYLKGLIPNGTISPDMGDVFRFPWRLPNTTSTTTGLTTTVSTTAVPTTEVVTTTIASTTVTTQPTTSVTVTNTTTTATTATTATTSSTTTSAITPATTATTSAAATAVTVAPTTAATSTVSSTDTTTVTTTTVPPPPPVPACTPFLNGVVVLNGLQLIAVDLAFAASTNKNVSNYAFFGIKYGNARRFQPSTMNLDASYYSVPSRPLTGYQCPQKGSDKPLSEDCLYLNVFVPPSVKFTGDGNCSSAPVIMFVHGGAYRSGNKDNFPGTDLANALDAIIVIPNYRLGIFGFFSTEDRAAPGNWALHDLKLAIKWINSNIQNFGGAPNRITLIGHSTGAALVSFLMLDPDNRALLQAAVAMSGSSLAPWAMARNSTGSAFQLARSMRCPDNTSDAAVTCLKRKTTAGLLEKASDIDVTLSGTVYGPVVDGILVPAEPAKVLASPSWKYSGSFTNGFMAQDASVLLAADQIWHDTSMDISSEPIVDWFEQLTFPDTVHGIYNCKVPTTHLMREVYDHYDLAKSHSWTETRKKLIAIATDLLFVVPAVKEAILYSSRKLAGAGSILYNISYSDKPVFRSLPETVGGVLGAPHGLDLAYLFGRTVARALLTGIPRSFDIASAYERQLINGIVQNRQLVNSTTATTNSVQCLCLDSSAGWVARKTDFSHLVHFWDRIYKSAC